MDKQDNLKFLKVKAAHQEDFVQYTIFPKIVSTNSDSIQSELMIYLDKINQIVVKYTQKYLWHGDGFKLICRNFDSKLLPTDFEDNDNGNLPPHLYGLSHYGDNIEDEWFIVFLLFQITKELDGTVAKVIDNDGEFLLIEAAEYLPKWANPEICENRVFIYQGALQIVPPKKNENHSITNIISQLQSNTVKYYTPSDIQNCIINRTKGYPEKIANNLHSATLYLPIGVAALLKYKPQLVAPAVQAFCNRDSIDLRACRAMKFFPPESRVYTRVTFTKCLYAMLSHSRYIPDKRTGWNLPLINSPQYKSHSLGANLACGFEILISQAKSDLDIESDREWHIYLKKLTDTQYFRGFLEHSCGYNELLQKAKEYYMSFRNSLQTTTGIGKEISNLTKTLDFNLEEFQQSEKELPEDDDDSWLNIDPSDLDKMLEDKYGSKKFVPLNSDTDPTNFSGKLTQFLDHISELEGAEFPQESPTRPPRGIKRNKRQTDSVEVDDLSNANKVSFDPNAFTCTLQKILDFHIPEDEWNSDSDMSEYENERDDGAEKEENAKEMIDYMKQMDKELSSSTLAESFKKVAINDAFEDVESFQPVDIDVNALKNILESYQSELGESGPASNMLGPMGVYLQPGSSQLFHRNTDSN